MALVLADRIRETTTTAGTGTITLAGAVTGYRSFATVGNGNTTYYTIAGQNTSEWEVGIGTYTAAGTTLSRDTVLASSNAGSLVTFSAGTKDVFVTYPAGKSLYQDANGSVAVTSGASGIPLTLTGGASSSNILSLNGSANVKLFDFNSTNVNGAWGSFSNSGTIFGYIGASAPILGGSASDFILSTPNALKLASSNTTRLTIASNGAITVAAPTSGVTLTVGGFSTNNVINVTTAAGATPIQVSDGTVTSWWFTNGTNGIGFGTQTAHALSLYTNNAARLQIASDGKVTINPPTSGTGLNVLSDIAAVGAVSITGTTAIQPVLNVRAGSGAAGGFNRARINLISQAGTGGWSIYDYGDGGDSFAIGTYAGSDKLTITQAGNVTINAPTSGTAPALTVAGDLNLTAGGLQLGSTAQNAIYKGGTDFFIARNYNQQYTVWEVWAPPSSNVLTDNRESTLALVREDTSGNAEFIDVYNNGYPTGSPVSVQYGIRIQKRGTGQYRPFVIDQYDGTTYSPILDISANRNISISAPTSGKALTVTGVSADAQIQFGNGSGQGYLYGNGGAIDFISGNTSWPIRFGYGTGTMSTESMRIDGSGNLGIGVTPSAWGVGSAAIESTAGNFMGRGQVFVASNVYNDGTDRYRVASAVSSYVQSGGTHYWQVAASGTAGTAVTWRSPLGITNAGQVQVGPPTSGIALAITGTAAGTAAISISSSATTGAQTATFSATNKPGTGTTSPGTWLPISLGGTTYYIPCWT